MISGRAVRSGAVDQRHEGYGVRLSAHQTPRIWMIYPAFFVALMEKLENDRYLGIQMAGLVAWGDDQRLLNCHKC